MFHIFENVQKCQSSDSRVLLAESCISVMHDTNQERDVVFFGRGRRTLTCRCLLLLRGQQYLSFSCALLLIACCAHYISRYFSFLEDCKDAKACTVLLRGGSKDVLNEVERNLADAMQVRGDLDTCLLRYPKHVFWKNFRCQSQAEVLEICNECLGVNRNCVDCGVENDVLLWHMYPSLTSLREENEGAVCPRRRAVVGLPRCCMLFMVYKYSHHHKKPAITCRRV